MGVFRDFFVEKNRIPVIYDGGTDTDNLVDVRIAIIQNRISDNMPSMGLHVHITPGQIVGVISSRTCTGYQPTYR